MLSGLDSVRRPEVGILSPMATILVYSTLPRVLGSIINCVRAGQRHINCGGVQEELLSIMIAYGGSSLLHVQITLMWSIDSNLIQFNSTQIRNKFNQRD